MIYLHFQIVFKWNIHTLHFQQNEKESVNHVRDAENHRDLNRCLRIQLMKYVKNTYVT